jgi:hypothetical protein
MSALEQLLYFIQQLHFHGQLSCYSIVLLAVAETRTPAPTSHQPEDKRT